MATSGFPRLDQPSPQTPITTGMVAGAPLNLYLQGPFWQRWFANVYQAINYLLNRAVYAETPGGNVDGNNMKFTLANPPNPATSLQLFVNGALAGGYQLAGNLITFAQPPAANATLVAFYNK